MIKRRDTLLCLLLTGLSLLLGGCKLEILNPHGVIARDEMNLLIDSTNLMLIVVIPVMLLTVLVAWRYRKKNTKAEYKPNWAHSYTIETICWAVPCVIIAILGVMTWVSSHTLDPYKAIQIKGKKPILIQAIALEWRWLFIYPEQHIATVNYLQIPIDTPIILHLTSDAPMNSLEIPQLAGQIYAMGGMQTTLNIAADKAGIYRGLSTNYSGDGFAGMTFQIKVGSDQEFTQWVHTVSRTGQKLTWADFNDHLVPPTKDATVAYFSLSSAENIFEKDLDKYMEPQANSASLP